MVRTKNTHPGCCLCTHKVWRVHRYTAVVMPRPHACANLTAVGFEPTPFRNGALSHRLRPLGQTVLVEWFKQVGPTRNHVLVVQGGCGVPHTWAATRAARPRCGRTPGGRWFPPCPTPARTPPTRAPGPHPHGTCKQCVWPVPRAHTLGAGARSVQPHDSCGVRTHALSEWRLEPPP